MHLNVLHPGSLCLRSFLSGTVVDVASEIDKLRTLQQGWESDNDSFQLHSFELLEIDVVNPLVP